MGTGVEVGAGVDVGVGKTSPVVKLLLDHRLSPAALVALTRHQYVVFGKRPPGKTLPTSNEVVVSPP